MPIWLVWVISGIALMFLEFLIPGGIVSFAGIAAMIVGASIFYGFIDTVLMSFAMWFITSILLLILLRSFFMKYFEGDISVQNIDEDFQNIGTTVLVIESILPDKAGRIQFQGTTWRALSDESIKEGSKAKLYKRDGINWIVKSIEE